MVLTNGKIILLLTLVLMAFSGHDENNFRALDLEDSLKVIENNKKESVQTIDPITIFNDKEFLNASQTYSWTGNGTVTNPFIIENYIINLQNSSLIGINIQNTTYSFTIQNVKITGGYAGILLNGVSNASVLANEATNNTRGFLFMNITNSLIQDNLAFSNNHTGFEFRYINHANSVMQNRAINSSIGFGVLSSTSILFQNNVIEKNEKSGFRLFESHQNTINENTISESEHGIEIFFSDSNLFNNNTISFCFDGIFVESDSNYNNFIYNIVHSNNNNGFTLNWGNNNNFDFNNGYNNQNNGFSIFYGSYNSFLNNLVSDNSNYGFYLSNNTKDNTLTNNTGCGNFNGSIVNESESNNLIQNVFADTCIVSSTTSISQSSNQSSSNTTSEEIPGFIISFSLFFSILGLTIIRYRTRKEI